MKRYTEINAAKVLNRFLNSARKQEYSANRTLMHFAYTTKDGYMEVCDGYRAIRLYNPVDGVEINPESTKMETVVSKFWKPLEEGKVKLIKEDAEPWEQYAPIIDVETVKAFIDGEKEAIKQRGKGKTDYAMRVYGSMYYNAKYIKDVLDMFPEAEIAWYIGTEDMPTLYAHSEYGDALILPIRIKKEEA